MIFQQNIKINSVLLIVFVISYQINRSRYSSNTKVFEIGSCDSELGPVSKRIVRQIVHVAPFTLH